MNSKRSNRLFYRILAIIAAIAVAIVCLPLPGNTSYAAESSTSNSKYGYFYVSAPSSTGIVRVMKKSNALPNGAYYESVYVDNSLEREIYSTNLDINIDMKNYAVGYHDIKVYF